MIRWPGHIKPGSVANEIVSGHDWFPTLLAAAGDPDVKEKLLKGMDVGGKTYKVHLDGFNQLPYLTGQAEKSPRRGFFYFDDDGDIVAVRVENWKIVFMEQRAPGTLRVWAEPFTALRLPKLFDLHADPCEQADITSNTYYEWMIEQGYILLAGSTLTGEFLATFKDFPPSQRPATFTIDQAMEKLKQTMGSQ
jgi:arylsulfatase